MDQEAYLDSRVAQPYWFRAPDNMDSTCQSCGHAIRGGETITEIDSDEGFEYVHLVCFEWKLADQREEQHQ